MSGYYCPCFTKLSKNKETKRLVLTSGTDYSFQQNVGHYYTLLIKLTKPSRNKIKKQLKVLNSLQKLFQFFCIKSLYLFVI